MKLTKTIKIKTLKQKTAAARRDLNATWDAQGCTNAIVLSAAAKLDELCNEYQRLYLSESASRITNPMKPMAIDGHPQRTSEKTPGPRRVVLFYSSGRRGIRLLFSKNEL